MKRSIMLLAIAVGLSLTLAGCDEDPALPLAASEGTTTVRGTITETYEEFALKFETASEVRR